MKSAPGKTLAASGAASIAFAAVSGAVYAADIGVDPARLSEYALDYGTVCLNNSLTGGALGVLAVGLAYLGDGWAEACDEFRGKDAETLRDIPGNQQSTLNLLGLATSIGLIGGQVFTAGSAILSDDFETPFQTYTKTTQQSHNDNGIRPRLTVDVSREAVNSGRPVIGHYQPA